MVFALNPLKLASERLVAMIFYRRASDPRESLSRLSMTISQALRLPQLVELMTVNVPRAFLSSGAALLVIKGESEFDVFASSDGLRRSAASSAEELIGLVGSNPILWSEAIYPAAEDDTPISLSEEFALCFPMSVRGHLLGIYLVAEKLSGKLYSAEELRALRTLAHHAATALDNAQTYESLSQLNAELEKLVEQRTAELQRANIELGHKNEELTKQNAELERVVAELRETQAALVEAERRAAIGEIIVTICHEINNPLTAIIGQAQLIQLHAESLPNPVLEKIKTIDQCADRIRDITEKMRRLTSTKTTTYVGQIKMIDLNQQEEEKPPAGKATASRSNLPD
jgi:GAF domain-containing protein